MRLPRLFRVAWCAAAFVVAVSCGASTSTPSPSVVASGPLQLAGCSGAPGAATETCSFNGSMTNNGPGCATDITGTTNSSDSNGATVGSASWTFSGTLAVGQTATYVGSGLAEVVNLVNNGSAIYHTLISATPVTCPS
jgi:hypothetical protein